MLNVTVKGVRGAVTLRCQGRLVRGQETALLCAAIQQHEREITLDLSGVTSIDACGMGALVSLQVAGIYLRLANPTEAVREVLTLTKLDSVFEIAESDLAYRLSKSPISERHCSSGTSILDLKQ
jgi:anti-sigma B factor antagonist